MSFFQNIGCDKGTGKLCRRITSTGKHGGKALKQETVYGHLENGNPVLADDYCLFNGTKSISKKRKYNMKYFVYSQKTNNTVTLSGYEPMTILQTITSKKGNVKERIIFFVDTNCKLSFVKTNQKNLQIDKTLDKIEKSPFFKSLVFLLFFHFLFVGVMRSRNYSFKDVYLSFGYDKSINFKVHFLFPVKIREKFAMKTGKISIFIHTYWSFIPMKEIYKHYVTTSEINTPIFIKLSHADHDYWYNFKSDSKHKYNKNHYLYNTRSYRLGQMNSELFIRKSITGQYVIVLTSIMSKSIIIKERFAYLISLFSINKKKYDIYFEKFSAGASESAFELFKYAFKMGDSCVYILEKGHPEFKNLKQQYGKALVGKNSFLAFYHIFLARSFQSSDLVGHIQRRLYDNDYLIKKKVLSTDKKIMLQHGPCMATNIFERGYFNRKVPIAPDYMLVNSNYEKNLFLKNTGYTDKELMVTGLPNIDLYVKEQQNEKNQITFMLTWRPWDLTGSIEVGSYLDRYFSFLELIRKEKFYKDKKINVILHPKSRIILQEQFPDIYDKYEESFYVGDIKDALLNSKVVISDYSSITFYAFAGGSNVIFYWEDKALAEVEYGAPNILQKEIAFGGIVERFKDLHSEIVYNYNNPQSPFHIAQFSKLMECTSGRNTENTYDYIQNIIFQNEHNPLEEESAFSMSEKQSSAS